MSTSSVATLLEIRNTAKQYSDLVNSNFITDAEWNGYINLSYFELYDLLIQKYGDDYYVASPYSITTAGTSQRYALPADFYKMLGLDLQVGSSPDSWVTIRPFMFAERNQYALPNMQSFFGYTNLKYRINGNFLMLIPIASAGQVLRLWYCPRLTELTADTSTVDGISGWQDYICVDAAMKAVCKQELDPSALMARKQGLIARIESAAENRDAGSPQVVSDSRSTDGWWSGNAGGGGWSGGW